MTSTAATKVILYIFYFSALSLFYNRQGLVLLESQNPILYDQLKPRILEYVRSLPWKMTYN